MFVGELGCFLVVLLSYLHTRFVASRKQSTAPLFAGGYRPIRDDDHLPEYHDGEEDGEDAEANHNNHTSEPTIIKPLDDADAGRNKLNGWRILMLAAPACCDILGTTMMNAGLLFVAASIYQMTRGALVLFVGLFSVLFLRRKLYLYQWLALVIVVLGVAIVGLSGALFGHDQGHDAESGISDTMYQFARDVDTAARTPEAVKVIIGVLLIAAAQIFTATQFVVEEWILENYAMDPLNVVGWEGFFGLFVTVIGMIILHLTIGSTDAGRYGYFDLKEGWRQVTHNRVIAVSSLLIMISIGWANLLFYTQIKY
jgi:drug/metabolite transporter (DMT)-like permease